MIQSAWVVDKWRQHTERGESQRMTENKWSIDRNIA